MEALDTTALPDEADATAPDGSEVRILSRLAGGGMAHFRLPPGEISVAVRHRTVGEIWFVTAGAARCGGPGTATSASTTFAPASA